MKFNPLDNGDVQLIANVGTGVDITITLSKQDLNELRHIVNKQTRLERAKFYANQYLHNLPVPEGKRHASKTAEANPNQIERIAERFLEIKSETVPDSITWEQAANSIMLKYLTDEWLDELTYDMNNYGPNVDEIIKAFNQRGYDDPKMDDDMMPDELADYLNKIILDRKISINRLLEVMLAKIWR